MRQAGSVEFCNVVDGVGEVRYSTVDEATNAVNVLNGTTVDGTILFVSTGDRTLEDFLWGED